MKKLLVLLAGIACLFIFAPATASAGCDLCGDLNGDGDVNILDVNAFIDWYFYYPYGATPACPYAADVNCDQAVTVNINNPLDTNTDLGYLIAYLYAGGPAPCDPDNDSYPNCDPYD